MNDNELLGDSGYPIWVEEIVDRHDLWLRSDSPIAAANTLLHDAEDNLKEITEVIFQEQAMTPDTLRRVQSCLAMLTDVVELARACPSEPEQGTVTKGEDGTLTWSPAP